jgi:hypothetical protein
MRQFPSEFEEMLSPRGRSVLARRDRISGVLAQGLRFVSAADLLAPKHARGALGLLERTMRDCLSTMDDPIPPSALWGMKKNYSERLPKTARVRTALMASPRSRGSQRAQEIGLTAMLRSESFHTFAEALSGFPLRRKRGMQVLCYGAHDYAGPHNDHHPEEPDAKHGYVDVHLTFCNASVLHQWLVYEHQGHLGQVQPVAMAGGVSCYRLPLWHYTTPLVARPGRLQEARRWVLLGTFLDEKPAAQTIDAARSRGRSVGRGPRRPKRS